jgi:hypothetical protein
MLLLLLMMMLMIKTMKNDHDFVVFLVDVTLVILSAISSDFKQILQGDAKNCDFHVHHPIRRTFNYGCSSGEPLYLMT